MEYCKVYQEDCILVQKVKQIPNNYYGLMAVPITAIQWDLSEPSKERFDKDIFQINN